MTHRHFIKSSGRYPAPKLSVLIPYYKDDPSPLLSALLAQATPEIEILLYDDGTGDAAVNAAVSAIIKAAKSRVTLIVAEENCGRSAGRNHLQETAKADWVLFLDADMRPETDEFLADYLALIAANTADVIFGGFTVPAKAESADQELHRALSEISDCLPLAHRQAHGPQHVATSNLCVRKSVLEAERFDPGFTGWGWEDSEWAARVSARYTLMHADIPAQHLGLESTETLLRRFRDSAQNYVRFTNKHPELAKRLALYSVSKRLQRVPAQKMMRPILRAIVKFSKGPIGLRLVALKLWRASWYAEVLP